MSKYDPASIEPAWQKYWAERGLHNVTEDASKAKKYVLEMFPYPSGDIHMGHVRNYTIGDVVARHATMSGFNVLHPIGWDAFGLPAENAAIKSGTHPATWTHANIAKQRASFERMGLSYDWDRAVVTCDVDYYRWGQWTFLKFWERGLVERRSSAVNWCPSCKTVLANEQVLPDGTCWRCGTKVVQRELEQWYYKITEYADELLADLGKMPGWPERVKTMQANWIGRSEGAEVDFTLCDEDGEPTDATITVFTTRPDTLFGATFFLLAPEHALVSDLVAGTEFEGPVRDVQAYAAAETAIEREAGERTKRGAFTGRYVVNPINGEKLPVWVANYVLMGYGTGAVMAVPAGDQRDFEFAQQYGLPIPPVVVPKDSELYERLKDTRDRVIEHVDQEGVPEDMRCSYTGPGIMVQSGEFTGLPGGKDSPGAKAVVARLEHAGQGRSAINFRLRDWLISRQRYWGNPIPAIHCPACGLVPVPEDQLPVVLPMDVDITKGETLADHPEFYETKCPRCGGAAKRETDTMDTFTCSSWYYLRYCDARNDSAIWDPAKAAYWMPADQYIGGIEHAILHLLYSRFFTKVFRDLGLVTIDEPFTNLLTQGMVKLDGFTMSKSRGNVVPPEEVIEKYGADTLRAYILFISPPEKDLEWANEGVEGMWRFLSRLWRLVGELAEAADSGACGVAASGDEAATALRRAIHVAIRKVGDDVARFQFNTALSAIMELVNAANDYRRERPAGELDLALVRETTEVVTLLAAPFVPHMAEELWQHVLGHPGSVHEQSWPAFDPVAAAVAEIQLAVQVNGKVRDHLTVDADATEDEIRDAALALERVAAHLQGLAVSKVLVVPGRLVSIVAR